MLLVAESDSGFWLNATVRSATVVLQASSKAMRGSPVFLDKAATRIDGIAADTRFVVDVTKAEGSMAKSTRMA